MSSTELFRTHPVYFKSYNNTASLLVITETHFALLDLGESMWQKILLMQLGLIGDLILQHLTRKQHTQALSTFQGKSLEEILSSSSKHLSIPYEQVFSFKVINGGWKNLGHRSVQFVTTEKKFSLFIPKEQFDTTVSFLRQFLRMKEQG